MSPWMAWQLIPRDISWVYQREPVEITVQSDQENRPDIAQYRLDVERNEKADIMVRLLEMGDYEPGGATTIWGFFFS